MYLQIQKFNVQSSEQAFYIDSYEMANIWKGHLTKLKVGFIRCKSDRVTTALIKKQLKTQLIYVYIYILFFRLTPQCTASSLAS